ncbi:MAG: hypothetical protein ACSW76_05110 [Bacteroidaceae bacterium]
MKLKSIIAVMLLFIPVVAVYAQEVKYSPRYYANRANGYVNSGAWNNAKREIDAGLEHFPDDPELRYLNGSYYHVIGDLKEARYNLVRAVQEDDQLFKAKRILVDVEEQLGHYSSAICYINELLEFQPYDRDLWRRKIAFYRRLGNDIEADASLERLSHIYPNDTLVVNDVRRRNQENWDNVLRKSSLSEAADNLEQWIDKDPRVRDYYIELISVYSKMGEYERAIGVANRGLVYFPDDRELINKSAGIMTDLGLYTQALSFVKSRNTSNDTYNYLLGEVATDARMHDPYEANGRLYETTHDRDALNYLLNTAITRGYFDDARYYIDEKMKMDGRTPNLLMKLYTLEKRSGNERRSLRILNELYELNPTDDELTDTYTELMLQLVTNDFITEQWEDARIHLDKILLLLPEDADEWPSVVSRQITVLGHLKRFQEARVLYNESSAFSPDNRKRFASAYEEAATVHLKQLMDDERYPEALKEALEMLEVVPESEVALRCVINMSQTLKKDDMFHEYAAKGYETYPDVPYFIVKQAISLQDQGKEANALAVLRPYDSSDEYMNNQLAAAYSGISQQWAMELMKERMPDIAMQIVDSALVHDENNRELLYTKGLAYESLKQYDKACEYQQRYYEPSNSEQEEFMEHIRFLSFRGFRNRIDATYTHGLYDTRYETLASTGHLYSIGSVSYSRLSSRNTFTAQISYKGIDGFHDNQSDESGGIGLELMGQWEHEISSRWSGMMNVAMSTRYFNKYGANLSLSYSMPHDWTPSLRIGYRRTPPTYIFLAGGNNQLFTQDEFNIFILTPSVVKSWERISLTAGTDLTSLSGDLFYNVSLKGKFLINNDNISSVSLVCGFGSFPELSFFEQTALRDVSHTNAMLGFDIQYLLTHNLCLGLTGSWNTCYNPYRLADGSLADSYRNIFSLAIQAHIAF